MGEGPERGSLRLTKRGRLGGKRKTEGHAPASRREGALLEGGWWREEIRVEEDSGVAREV